MKHAAWERAKGKDVADRVETGKVFVDEDGTWLHPEKVSDEFRPICRRADLPPQVAAGCARPKLDPCADDHCGSVPHVLTCLNRRARTLDRS